MSSKKQLLSQLLLFLYMLLLMAYAAFSLAFSLLSYTETLHFSLDFAGIQDNWSSDVINGLSIETSAASCPSGTEALFNWTWPGTMPGCNCINTSFNNGTIYPSPCTGVQNASGCQQLPPADAIPFTAWKSGVMVCVSRISDYNFAAQHLKNSAVCPSGHIPCGQSLDYLFCVMNGTDCPLTSIVVSDENPDPLLYLENQPFFDRYQVWYSRVFDSTPIVQGKISQNNPCFDYTLTNTDEGETDYVLLRTKRTYCAEDMRWVPLSTITEQDFYSANVNITNFTAMLPNYTISDYVNERLWSLYFRNVIPMRFEFICRSAIDKLIASDQVYSTEIDTQLINLVVSAVVFFLFVAFYPYFQMTLFFGKNLRLRKITDEVILEMRLDQKNTIARVVKLMQLPFVLVAMLISYSDMQVFQEIYDQQCSDPITNVQFQESAANIRDKTYYYNVSNFIFLCVLIALDGLIMLALAITEKVKEKKRGKHHKNEDYDAVKPPEKETERKEAESRKHSEYKKEEGEDDESPERRKSLTEKKQREPEEEKKAASKEKIELEMVSFEFPTEEMEEKANENKLR